MNRYEFRRDEFTWAEEFYDILQQRMGFPEYFGKNADALWDMLSGYIDLPCEIVLKGFSREENEYNRNMLRKIMQCFSLAEQKFPGQFVVIRKD